MSRIILAPMEDVSDAIYRRLCRSVGGALVDLAEASAQRLEDWALLAGGSTFATGRNAHHCRSSAVTTLRSRAGLRPSISGSA